MAENSNPVAAVINNAIKAAEKIAPLDNEYIDDEGLLRCSICHERHQTRITLFGRERVVRCVCPCTDTVRQMHEQDRQQRIYERRKLCFHGTKMISWNFANDDRKRPEISDAMQQYAEQFKEHHKNGKGVLLYGPIGTGKTYLAACIANRVIDQGYTAYMVNFNEIEDNLQSISLQIGRQAYMDSLCRYDLLILDDLGVERKSEYMQGLVYSVIDARYRTGGATVITTNLTQAELGNPANIEQKRIYDRILEHSLPVKMDGASRRREAAVQNKKDMRQQIGLEA